MSTQFDVGSWGLFCGQGGKQLLLVDDKPCGPVSARKVIRAVPRRLLLDENRVSQAMERSEASTELAPYGDTEWVVTLRPMISPRTGTTVAVLAIVTSLGQDLPEPPLVGNWEWEIARDENGRPTPHRRSYWDRNLFRLYAVDPAVARAHESHWETGEWSNELIDQADQMRISSSIRDGIQDGIDGLWGVVRCLTCNVVTGYGSPSPGRKHLRLVGQIAPIKPEDDVIYMRGFSYEAPATFHDLALEHDAARVDDVLRGVMELTREPMAVVDAATLDVLMTSPAWRREDFGHVGGLGEFVASGLCELHALIQTTARNTDRSGSMRVSLRRTDGSARHVTVAVTGVTSGARNRDVVIRLDL